MRMVTSLCHVVCLMMTFPEYLFFYCFNLFHLLFEVTLVSVFLSSWTSHVPSTWYSVWTNLCMRFLEISLFLKNFTILSASSSALARISWYGGRFISAAPPFACPLCFASDRCNSRPAPTRALRFYLNYETQCLAVPAVDVPRDALTMLGGCILPVRWPTQGIKAHGGLNIRCNWVISCKLQIGLYFRLMFYTCALKLSLDLTQFVPMYMIKLLPCINTHRYRA